MQAAGAKVAPVKQERTLYLQCSQLGSTEVQQICNNNRRAAHVSRMLRMEVQAAFGFHYGARDPQRPR